MHSGELSFYHRLKKEGVKFGDRIKDSRVERVFRKAQQRPLESSQG